MLSFSLKSRVGALALTLAVAGCSAGGGSALAPTGAGPSQGAPTAGLPALKGPNITLAPSLYIANAGGSSSSSSSSSSSGGGFITVYRLGLRPHVVRTICDGINEPRAMAFDVRSNLYVANGSGSSSSSSSSSSYTNGDVTEYQAGTSSEINTISHGVSMPTAVAVDSKGFVYVANGPTSSSSSSSSGTGSITVYKPLHQRVVRMITNGVGMPIAMQFDKAGNLYVLNGSAVSSSSGAGANGSVSVYGFHDTDPKLTITNGISSPVAMTVDAVGDVVVANGGSSSSSSSSSSGSSS